ncbi:MAG: hypothetical protein IKN49_04545 [Elusimicrobiaceae bacterium]|nr:hypothetical protein [Candidatus Saccharibacteria bacterium]MBR3204225.1 hypothetical protein [Candidatus Saccharibacteria bacterium]MBR3632305.1 hypothetical protein [Elusimicrobiaceae bacterium]
MPNIKPDRIDQTGIDAANGSVTFEQFLKRVGYKPLNFPDFDTWLKRIFDANGNGKIDKGSEKRKYNKATRNSGTVNEYLAEWQHAQAAAIAEDNATVDNLRILWQQGQTESAKEVASRDALTKERNNMAGGGQKKDNTAILIAAAAIAILLLIK